jgi:hypothetical protein
VASPGIDIDQGDSGPAQFASICHCAFHGPLI